MSGIRNLTGICHDLRMKLIYRIKYEASKCRHSPKWAEYLEQERAVLQEIISGNEAGCDISRTDIEKRQNNILLREGGQRHERKVFKSGRYHGNSWNFQVSSIQAYAGTERRNGKERLYCNSWKSKQKVL